MRSFSKLKMVLLAAAFALLTACGYDAEGTYTDASGARYTFNEGVVKFTVAGIFPVEASYKQDGDEVIIDVEGEQIVYIFNDDGDLVSDEDMLKRVKQN